MPGGSCLDPTLTMAQVMLAFFQAHCPFFLTKNVGVGEWLQILYAVLLCEFLLDFSDMQLI